VVADAVAGPGNAETELVSATAPEALVAPAVTELVVRPQPLRPIPTAATATTRWRERRTDSIISLTPA
jgi:hypothetical protein